MIRCFVILFTFWGLAACIDRVSLPVRSEEPRLVVEGQITNEAPPYVVKLSYTTRYDADGNNLGEPLVGDAQVQVGDDQGRSARFALTGTGTYQTTDSLFRGQPGRAYSLTVVLSNGNRYVTPPERMPVVPPIDSLSARLVRTSNQARPYQVEYGVTTRDPAAERNFYRWTAYGFTSRLSTGVPCNLGSTAICFDRCWPTETSADINIYSDEAINGNSIANRSVLRLPVYALAPQFVEVQQYGITPANYQFWQLYRQQAVRTGTIFDPLPAPITGNLVNANDPSDRARGYFAVTSITRRRIRTDKFEAPFYAAMASWLFGQLLPIGDCRRTYGPVPVVGPLDW